MDNNIVTFMQTGLLPALISLVGVFLSHKLAVGETEKAMEIFKSQLSQNVYASSKRSDMEYEVFHKLSKIGGDIYLLMERFYPDELSLYQINDFESPNLRELALKIHELDIELNIHRVFIPKEILENYESLVKNANEFFAFAEKHLECWDDTKEDRKRKANLRDIAYEKRLSFERNWKMVGTEASEYLKSKELV